MVLQSPWSRAIIAMGFIEAAFMFGAFAYVGADLHLRFGVGFTVVGLFVGAFAIGGLIYSLSVRVLVNRLGQVGLVTGGGMLLTLAYMTIAFAPRASFAPFAITAIGLGYYMLLATGNFDTPLVFACVVFLTAMGIALFYSVGLLELVLGRWNRTARIAQAADSTASFGM